VRPRIAVPVHGEARHLMAQARLAEECRVPQTIVTRNGGVVRLAPGPAAVIGEVPTGRLAADGKALLDAASETLKNRQRMTFNGAAFATIVLDGDGRTMAPPSITIPGLAEANTDATKEMQQKMLDAIAQLGARERRDDEAVREAVRIAVRRVARARHGKRPVTEIHIIRLAGREGRG
jgi:ribonuclease J